MAYMNWGAKVWCDGEAKHGNCDNTPLDVLAGTNSAGGNIFAHLLRRKKAGEDIEAMAPVMEDMYHAVVGDKDSGILLLIYKACACQVVSVSDGEPTELERIRTWDDDWEPKDPTLYERGGIAVTAGSAWEPERICVSFTDPLGRKWTALSGYMLGEGHEDWD